MGNCSRDIGGRRHPSPRREKTKHMYITWGGGSIFPRAFRRYSLLRARARDSASCILEIHSMRRQSTLQLIFITILVISFLHLLSTVLGPVLRTILLDIGPYALSKEELAVPSSVPTNDNGASTIPKIIHQIYLGL